MLLTSDTTRLLVALTLAALYTALCLVIWRRARPRGTAELQLAGHWLVAHASQTGLARALAESTVNALRAAGHAVSHCELGQLSPALIQGADKALFLVSTQGDGDAPDHALRFAREHLPHTATLAGLQYAVLALGDRSYTRFCGFGRNLDAWLQASGARSLFSRIEVDRGDPAAIERWHEGLRAQGASEAICLPAEPFRPWKISRRQMLNSGSSGAGLFHLSLKPADDALPAWQAGDLVEVQAPGDAAPRQYSIASIPAEGSLQLLVREHARGLVSPRLCRLDETVMLRLKPHPGFQLGDNAQRPLILIGNGSGLAGLRALLAERLAGGQTRNWLIFGERHAAHDNHCAEDLAHWHDRGQISHLDLCFSREMTPLPYVQHALRVHAARLRAWVADGAAIYVCGSAQGMAGAVDATLQTLLGEAQHAALRESGRYRRDVY